MGSGEGLQPDLPERRLDKEHSPYWYFYYHEGGKQRTLYLGKTKDPERELTWKREKRWLASIESRGYRLPSHAQRLFEESEPRPDFFYDGDYGAAI